MVDLSGKIALVSGASRGAGRGIALVLGEAGATVYVTGRSNPEETAALVTERGGQGIPVRCDHTDDAQVEALFERITAEGGRLDLLVNNVWGGYEGYEQAPFDAPFWEQPLWRWEGMFAAGVRAHYTAARLAAPLMMAPQGGLIVNTTAWDQDKYLGNLIYDVAKAAINRMAFGMARELREYNIAAIALAPGWMRTEAVLDYFKTDEDHWRDVPELQETESPQYVGRAIVALAGDPQLMAKSGRTLAVGDLAREYDFTDVDGRQVPTFHIPA